MLPLSLTKVLVDEFGSFFLLNNAEAFFFNVILIFF